MHLGAVAPEGDFGMQSHSSNSLEASEVAQM